MTYRETSTVDELVERCKQGELSAFRGLYDSHAQHIYRICLKLSAHPTDAEDAMQMVFTQALRSLHKFDGTSQFSSWLYGIAVRVVGNQRRAKRRRGRLKLAYQSEHMGQSELSTPSPEHRTAARQQLNLLRKALAGLPAPQRVAFVLYHVENMKLRQIADIMHAPIDTTYSRIKAARSCLTEMMASLEEDRTTEQESRHDD
ncbi:MAG: RNA polymerase sigma factor [Myxococcota bacterium]